jgi:hypothetical protein
MQRTNLRETSTLLRSYQNTPVLFLIFFLVLSYNHAYNNLEMNGADLAPNTKNCSSAKLVLLMTNLKTTLTESGSFFIAM